MEKQKENLFVEKFRLLNSQTHSEDINWSSSCSSEYEDTPLNDKSNNRFHKTHVTKRKRKKKAPNNISNLSITILDTSKNLKNVIYEEKSPILCSKIRRKSVSLSPILKSTLLLNKINAVSSPVLTSKTVQTKSPVLLLKTKSPKTVKVRKKLFKNCFDDNENSENPDANKQRICSEEIVKRHLESVTERALITSPSRELKEIVNQLTNTNSSKAKLELVKRVKSFFDSNFSSQNSSPTSQESISDIVTPKNSTKSSDEIEIFTCKSQVTSNSSLKQENSMNSTESSVYNINKNSKKIHYKKDGHAYRLNNLLKKQNASLALWQHERFMAANSNFVIPKGEYTVFRIQNINFKYGCHLIESMNSNDEKYLILINSCYVFDNIFNETVLKLYEPYSIVQFSEDCKLLINVTKFECSNFDN